MKKIKILSVFGTRPEAIKMAPLVKELEKRPEVESKVLVTAQHREMLDSVLELFDIVPEYDLNLMKAGQTLSDITAGVLKGVEEVLKKDPVNAVLVHGDTSTTFAAALAAFYQKIPVGHVEAGLRTGDIYSPWPEEMNRLLTDRLSTWYFAPTVSNEQNLLRENIQPESIVVTGNTVIDALLHVIDKDFVFEDPALRHLKKEEKLLLLTCHRRENWGQPMEDIFTAVRQLADAHEDIKVIFPMHKNPIVGEAARKHMGSHPRILLIDPLDYKPFANLMDRSYLVLTDSGGLQEEAPALGKPVLVLRTETERPEAVEAGTVKIAGVNKENIVALTQELLQREEAYHAMAKAVNPYGDGQASRRIADFLCRALQSGV